MELRDQIKRIKQIVHEDAEIRGMLLNEEGKTCVIGGIIVSLGYILEVGQRFPRSSQYDALFSAYPFLRKEEDKITPPMEEKVTVLDRLMIINDAFGTVERRRIELCNFLDTIHK